MWPQCMRHNLCGDGIDRIMVTERLIALSKQNRFDRFADPVACTGQRIQSPTPLNGFGDLHEDVVVQVA